MYAPPAPPNIVRYDYDLPILAMDMVIAGGAITLAVVDACPLSSNLSLPRHYLQTMHELQVRVLLVLLPVCCCVVTERE